MSSSPERSCDWFPGRVSPSAPAIQSYPFNLLTARFSAILQEIASFNTRAASLLSVLEKDTTLLDRILFGAALERWGTGRSQLTGATAFRWDFGMGFGAVPSDIPMTDPTTSVVYPALLPGLSLLSDLKTSRAPARQRRPAPGRDYGYGVTGGGHRVRRFGHCGAPDPGKRVPVGARDSWSGGFPRRV